MSNELSNQSQGSNTVLPLDAKQRKAVPLATGVLDYFPDALVEVAITSRLGNEQHNPGQPLHWAKEKSTDHADCILRHLVDRGKFDTDGQRHSAKVAWRALAILQIEIEAEKAGLDYDSYVKYLKDYAEYINGSKVRTDTSAVSAL